MLTVHHIPAAFSNADCDRAIDLARAAPSSDARLVGRNRDHNLRRADLVWIDEQPEAAWIMDRIIDIVREANRDAYSFDLDGFDESAQLARYGSERQGHFDWHSDIGDGHLAARRKLTLVIQLSAASDYTGGRLEVMPSAQTHQAPTERGTATLFPSYMLHRVTPVDSGERHSLTIWAHGPSFR
ncbi:2OG-Fe(II) oxygenase [Salipiger sp. 1_MG-2023]|uniref:2OG-Fe(II) oxygenase n=1 Tax=Salipiger sp. 1_MG-2023 TaxID=3062665 RepID=UPI0026E2E590|nr:2OG-Fe(II) oxygenase [Salipiger sp. 1_MG-2023]MDO6585675.1 2OG-Fe(II) oxygenase [Salipiger sp. 1_MG-2023]